MAKIRTKKAETTILGEEEISFISEIEEFDKYGNLISDIIFSEQDKIAIQSWYKYNKLGKPIEIINVDKEAETTEKTSFEYDEEGHLLREETDYFQGFKTILTYLYDNNNITINSIDEDDNIEESTLQEFDDQGNLICESKFDDNNKLVEKTVNIYDHQQKIIKKDELDRKEKLSKSHTYYYDNKGKLEGVKTTNRKGKVLDWVKVEYDEKDRPAQQTAMSGHKIVLEYNEDELSRTEKHIDPHGNTVKDVATIKNKEGNILEEHSPDTKIIYTYDYYTE